jgi:chromosome segregation ATPase
MSKQIDTFCENLRGKLNEMDARLQQLKTSAKAGSEKADQALQAQAKSLRTSIDAGRNSVETAKTRMKAWAGGKKASLDQKVASWKAERNQAHLKRRADDAEAYASDAFAVAAAAVDEAHEAAIDAVLARGDADAAEAASVKQSA